MCLFQVLDEIYRILRSVRVSPSPPRAHELLQELRDISSMAMEHFDEKVAPSLRNRMPDRSKQLRMLNSYRNHSVDLHLSGVLSFAGLCD